MKKALLLVQLSEKSAVSNWLIAARCFWMKSPILVWTFKHGFFAFYKPDNLSALAEHKQFNPIFV